MCIGGKKPFVFIIFVWNFFFLRPTNENTVPCKWMRLSKRIMWKTSLNLLWTLFMAFCFLSGPNTNTEVLLVHTALVVLFYLFFLQLLTRQRKSSIENAAPLTISFCMRWIWMRVYSRVCVCLRHVYFPHHKHQKHTCFAFEKAKWVVCVWVGFFLFFFFALRSFIKQYDFDCFLCFP